MKTKKDIKKNLTAEINYKIIFEHLPKRKSNKLDTFFYLSGLALYATIIIYVVISWMA